MFGRREQRPQRPTCTTPAAQVPQQLYPLPGATNVPDGVGILIYQGYQSSANTVSLVDGVLSTVATSPTAVPLPLPTGAASPSRSGGTTYAVTFPLLRSGATYTVNYTLPTGCNPLTAQFGYFATL